MQDIITTNDVIEEISYCSEDEEFLNNHPGILKLVNNKSWVQGIADTATNFLMQDSEESAFGAILFALYHYWSFEYDDDDAEVRA